MLKTTLWNRQVSGYNKEEANHPKVKVFSHGQETEMLIFDTYWATPSAQAQLLHTQGQQSKESEKCSRL